MITYMWLKSGRPDAVVGEGPTLGVSVPGESVGKPVAGAATDVDADYDADVPCPGEPLEVPLPQAVTRAARASGLSAARNEARLRADIA